MRHLKTEVSKQLADLFILFFMAVVFPWVLKTAKVLPDVIHNGNISCVVFVKWQNAFDTLDHQIL